MIPLPQLGWLLTFSTKDHNQDTLKKPVRFDADVRLNLF